MRFDNLMIEEVITLAYSIGAPKTNLPDNVTNFSSKRPLRSYCPECLTKNNFEKVPNKKFYCGACHIYPDHPYVPADKDAPHETTDRCPSCLSSERLEAVPEARFHCRSCAAWFNKPFVIQVTASFAAGSQSSKADNDWLIIDAHKAGKILDQLKKLPKEARAWALWKYHPEDMVELSTIKRNALAVLDTEKFPLKSYSQVDDAIEVILNMGACARRQIKATSDLLARGIGVEESNFRGNKKWSLFRNKIEAIFDTWDTSVRHAAHDGLMEIQGATPKPASARSQ